ncbi:MAG: NADH-quinone oxidoreductase subunit C [Pseudomonadota bacterium]
MNEEDITVKKLREQFQDSILDVYFFRDEATFVVRKEDILPIARFVHSDKDLSYDFLSDLCCVDYLEREPRFEIVYHLYSIKKNKRVRIKAPIPSNQQVISSVNSVWKTADWLERECYDMYGIGFEGHPDLRRILLTDDWEGYPLRKDYPLKGK